MNQEKIVEAALLFKNECEDEVRRQGSDEQLLQMTREWFNVANGYKYSYHFEWLGRPIIQYPQDVMAIQEIVWKVQPDLIVETGIAHGGSLILSAALLELIAICGGSSDAEVVGIDIDIRVHNRAAIEEHPMSRRIRLIEGSSINGDIIRQVVELAKSKKRVLVFLDSNHTHEHVLAELNAYASLVTCGSYCVVFDTIIEDMPEEQSSHRPWTKKSNPKTAVREWLKENENFVVDKELQDKLLITVAPDGYLRRIS